MAELRRSKRERDTVDYAAIEEGQKIPLTSDYYFLTPHDMPSASLKQPASVWVPLVEACIFTPWQVRRLSGDAVTLAWARDGGLLEPALVPHKEGLGLVVPPASFSVRDVAATLGPDTAVNVMDVASQEELGGWTLGRFADYFESSPARRHALHRSGPLNVISLEFSGTALAPRVVAPSLVRALDWVETSWPRAPSLAPVERCGARPTASHYCLMSVAGCYTDFHMDFGGTSVWYHVLRGRKTFLLVPPSEHNFAAFTAWSSSPTQASTFFADAADRCHKLTVESGQTLLIPSGWIHAVYTSVDSLVFGGNYLCSVQAETQLRVCAVERALRVRARFRFPGFEPASWFAGAGALICLRAAHAAVDAALEQSSSSPPPLSSSAPPSLSAIECSGLAALAAVLSAWQRRDEDLPRVVTGDGLKLRLTRPGGGGGGSSGGGGEASSDGGGSCGDSGRSGGSGSGGGASFAAASLCGLGGPESLVRELSARLRLEDRRLKAAQGTAVAAAGAAESGPRAAAGQPTEVRPKLMLSLKRPAPEPATELTQQETTPAKGGGTGFKLKLMLRPQPDGGAHEADGSNGSDGSPGAKVSTGVDGPGGTKLGAAEAAGTPDPPDAAPDAAVRDAAAPDAAASDAAAAPLSPQRPTLRLKLQRPAEPTPHEAPPIGTWAPAAVRCAVHGCGACDEAQSLLPHGRRTVTGLVTSNDVEATARGAAYAELPPAWTLQRDLAADDAAAGTASADPARESRIRLFPICTAHNRELGALWDLSGRIGLLCPLSQQTLCRVAT